METYLDLAIDVEYKDTFRCPYERIPDTLKKNNEEELEWDRSWKLNVTSALHGYGLYEDCPEDKGPAELTETDEREILMGYIDTLLDFTHHQPCREDALGVISGIYGLLMQLHIKNFYKEYIKLYEDGKNLGIFELDVRFCEEN